MRLDTAFWGHERRISKNDIGVLVPSVLTGKCVVLVNVGGGEAVKIEVHQRQAYHVGGDVVTSEVPCQTALFVWCKGDTSLDIRVVFQNVFVGGD